MDFIDTRKQKKLYVGTDRGVILLIDIAQELDTVVQAENSNLIEEEMDMDYDANEDIGDFNDMDGMPMSDEQKHAQLKKIQE